jgi:hypothetical protein
MIVMKTVFARVITALVMIAGFTSCIWAGSKGEHVTEKRHVADFTSIDIKSVGSVYFTQSSDFSCTIEGEESHMTFLCNMFTFTSSPNAGSKTRDHNQRSDNSCKNSFHNNHIFYIQNIGPSMKEVLNKKINPATSEINHIKVRITLVTVDIGFHTLKLCKSNCNRPITGIPTMNSPHTNSPVTAAGEEAIRLQSTSGIE